MYDLKPNIRKLTKITKYLKLYDKNVYLIRNKGRHLGILYCEIKYDK